MHAQRNYLAPASETLQFTRVKPLPAARYRPLGTFRFGLALLVVLQHFQHLLPRAGQSVFHFMGFGAIAVCVFFAVSGFVVAEANAVFYAGRPGAFLVNRLVRLVPPYAWALAVSIAVHAALWHAHRLALWDFTIEGSPLTPRRLLAGLLGIVPGLHAILGGEAFEFIPFAWTLRVEMAFYLAAACLYAVSRSWPGAPIPAAGLAAGLLGSALFLLGGRPGLLSTAPMFLLGVAICLLLARATPARWLFGAAAAGLTVVGFLSWDQHGLPDPRAQLVLLAALLAVFCRLAGAAASPGWKRVDRALGDLSYPLYLNHYVVGIALYDLFPARGLVAYAAGVVLAVGVAWLAAQAVDRPLIHLRNRVRGTTL